MDRRKLVAGVAAGFAVLLLVLAASSGPIRVWVTPPSDTGPPSIDAAGPLGTVASPGAEPVTRSDAQPSFDIFMQVIGVLLIVLVVALAVWVVRAGIWPRLRWRGPGRRWARQVSPLPEVPEGVLMVDVDAARIALAAGSPRNAIVACWMQLERDAAAAGLARADAETSAEYVERVVAASSVDPAPIQELAALYREARFSRHELRDDHRGRAFAALIRVEAELKRSVEVLA